MVILILLALANGMLIAVGRAINGRLGRRIGALTTALWVHGVGFVFLSLWGLMFGPGPVILPAAPPNVWLGGVLGVAFVALNSHALPRLGAGMTTSLVVGAQMLASVILDAISRPLAQSQSQSQSQSLTLALALTQPLAPSLIITLAGALLVIVGVLLIARAPPR